MYLLIVDSGLNNIVILGHVKKPPVERIVLCSTRTITQLVISCSRQLICKLRRTHNLGVQDLVVGRSLLTENSRQINA